MNSTIKMQLVMIFNGQRFELTKADIFILNQFLIQSNQTLQAIKYFRYRFDIGLQESKDCIDWFRSNLHTIRETANYP